MAKLEIFNSKQEVQGSTVPRTSTLALPLSLAKQVGAGVNAITKSIADIQKDLYAIQDENEVNEILPSINIKIQKSYEKYANSTDQQAPFKFEKDLGINNFEEFLKDKSKPVQKLLTNKIAEKKALLVPKLVGAVSTNLVSAFTVTLDKQFDNAIAKMISPDQAEMAEGTIAFEQLINNEAYKNYVGAKDYDTLVKKKTNLKNKLLLNSNLQVAPKSILENKEALVEAVGTDAAEEYVKEAKLKIISDSQSQEQKNNIQEILENKDQIGAFTEVLIRINNLRKFDSEEFANEVPTINELYQMYEGGMINEAMFVKLSDHLTGKDDNPLTDNEIFNAITVQIYSAKTIQQLDDIKKSYILDNNILKNMALEDINAFDAIIDKAKKDFSGHKDYKFYSELIDKNIRNISTVSGNRGQRIAAAIANKEQFIKKSYMNKVLDGMSPENAYLSVLQEDFDKEHVPNLDQVSFPTKIENWGVALADKDFFDNQSNLVLERFKNSNKSTFDAKRMIDDLDEIKFAADIFKIRYSIYPGSHEEKFKFAVGEGSSRVKFNLKEK
ncbi:hypothetical protein [uncultured Mediterranean phage uvMED]|nr:hypothetical protein [uncultured Mediterranean phage uvMED]